MKNVARTVGIFSAVVGVVGCAAFLVVGCGGDDTIVGSPGDDAGPDSVGFPETGIGDSARRDASGGDTGIADSGSDAFRFDAGTPDLAGFYHQIDLTACNWIAHCCGTGSDVNIASCVDTYDNNPAISGFIFTRPLKVDIDGGHAVLDQTKANECLNRIQSFSCGTVTSAELKAFRDACYDAVVGQIAPGSTGCQRSFECQPPSHCETGSDGGGTCTAPLALGASCTSYDQCGLFESGDPRYCALDAGGSPYDTAAKTNTCLTPQPVDSTCYGPAECASWVCDYPSDGGAGPLPQCLTEGNIINPDLCGSFPTPDAGDGG